MSNLLPNYDVNLHFGGDFDYEEIPRSLFAIQVVDRGLRSVGYLSVKWDEPPVFKDVDVVDGWTVKFQAMDYTNNEARYYVETAGDTIFYFSFRNKRLSFNVAGQDEKAVNYTLDVIKKVFPVEPMRLDSDSVNLGVWSQGAHGPTLRDKQIKPLLWHEISKNYSTDSRRKLHQLMGVRPPLDGGRMILWHGDPGTGKSSAIRSLMYSWLPWCNTNYVSDAEEFFGNADYMLRVLLSNKNESPEWMFEWDEGDEEAQKDLEQNFYTLKSKERWNLLIVEDADEFLQHDAKDRTGQALSRLLNLTDGLLGQGLNYLILITTNEKMSGIHPAVARPGRCMANINFDLFTHQEAKAWLESMNLKSNLPLGKEYYSLAELYDMRQERTQIKTEETLAPVGLYL